MQGYYEIPQCASALGRYSKTTDVRLRRSQLLTTVLTPGMMMARPNFLSQVPSPQNDGMEAGATQQHSDERCCTER